MTKRNYGIELLRLVFMFMIVMWHILGYGGIITHSFTGSTRVIYGALIVLCYCAVDGFAFLSGYVSTKNRKKEKIVNMWFQVFFYSFFLTIILALILHQNLGTSEILKYVFPISHGVYWYMTAYFILLLVMPMLNKYLFELDEKESKKIFVLLFVLFSCISFVSDPFKTDNGYSALWLIVLYIMGVLARKIDLFHTRSNASLLFMFFLSSFITWGCNVSYGYDKFINYLSPTMLINAMTLVVLFSRFKLKGDVLSKIGPLALVVYLFHLNPIVWSYFENAFSLLTLKPVLYGIFYVFLYSYIIVVIGLFLEWIRKTIADWLNINESSKGIVQILESFFLKMSIIFK